MRGYVDYIIFQAKAGEVFKVNVFGDVNEKENLYRLYVTGTGFDEGPEGSEKDANAFNHWNVEGPHLWVRKS